MPRLSRIVIYPVKSLDGVDVQQADVLPSGALRHDRRFAMHDAEGRIVNGKRTAAVHQLQLSDLIAACGHAGVIDWLEATTTAAEEWLSQRLEMPVHLRENTAAGFPDDNDSPGPTVISVATLETVASWFPGLSVDDVRGRFRANLEIDGVDPFWEDRLYGEPGVTRPFAIGGLRFEGVNPCQRCVVPTRSQTTGDVWPGFAREFARRREETLPPWAARRRFDHFYRLAVNTRLAAASAAGGRVQVGDELRLA